MNSTDDFYHQLNEHYVAKLHQSEQQAALFLSVAQDGGKALCEYLKLVARRVESTREFLSGLPQEPSAYLDETHRLYANELAHLEDLKANYEHAIFDVVVVTPD